MAFNTSQFQTGALKGTSLGNFMSGGFTPSVPTTYSNTQEDDTYNPRYPGFNKENYEKLERKVAQLGLTGSKKQEVMDEFYRQILPQVENEKKRSQRNEVINQKSYQVSQIKDESERKVAKNSLTVEELAQMVKEKENLREDAPDAAVFNAWIKSIPNGNELLANYMNKGDDTLLYKGGLKEESGWQKAGDFAVGVAQSPGKWGYNIIGQWMDRLGKWGAEQLQGSDLQKWVQDKAVEMFGEDEVKRYQEEKAKQLEEGTAFKGRTQTDITKPILGEYRANNGYTKAGEVVGDIASGIALTAPLAAATAPMYASATAGGAATLGALEGAIGAGISKLGTTGEGPDVQDLVVGGLTGIAGGLFSRYLQNLPKSEAENVRKQAETYINKSIKPTVKGKMNQADYDKFIDDTLDVANVMNKNKNLIQYTDDAGEVVTGKLPTNLRETSEALGNLKKSLYDAYNNIAKEAGDKGARVNMNKAFDQLDDILKDPSQGIANPQTRGIVDKFKQSLLDYTDDAGTISIEDAQKLTQDFNQQLKAFFRNPNMNDVSKSSIIAKLNKWTKDAINDSIDDVLDKGINGGSSQSQYYSQLKQMYGKILTIEDEISKRALVEARKNSKGLSTTILDALAGGEATDALLTLDPAKVGKAAAMKLISKYYKYINDPNVQINNLFKLVENGGKQSAMSNVANGVSNVVKEGLSETVRPNILASTTEVLTNE